MEKEDARLKYVLLYGEVKKPRQICSPHSIQLDELERLQAISMRLTIRKKKTKKEEEKVWLIG